MILGIDIGGTYMKSALVYQEDQQIKFSHQKKQATLAKDREGKGILQAVLAIVSDYQNQFELTGVAISTAGVVDGKTFDILYANENIPHYKGINIVREIKQAFELPCVVENDVNAATLGEWQYGSGKGCPSILCLTVGTGIGGGLILENQLYRGATYSAAEVGYMTLGDSTFEKLASTQRLVDTVRKQRNDPEIEGEAIFELAKKGDTCCQQAIQELVQSLVAGVSNCVYLVNPEKVILGGGIMEQKEYLIPLIQAAFEERFENSIGQPEIVAASLGNAACLAGVYGLFHSVYK